MQKKQYTFGEHTLQLAAPVAGRLSASMKFYGLKRLSEYYTEEGQKKITTAHLDLQGDPAMMAEALAFCLEGDTTVINTAELGGETVLGVITDFFSQSKAKSSAPIV